MSARQPSVRGRARLGDLQPTRTRPGLPATGAAWGLLGLGLALWLAAVLLGNRIPPFQSPDEGQHLGRAAAIAAGQWGLTSRDGGHSGAQADTALLTFQALHDRLITDSTARLTDSQRQAVRSLQWSGELDFRPLPGTGYYLPLIYAPHALGLKLGMALELTIMQSHRVARALVVATSLLLLFMAWRLWRPPAVAVALLALPMSLFQALAPVIDGLAHAMTVLALSLFLHLRRQAVQHGVVATGPALGLGVVGVVLAGSRLHMAPLLLLLPALALMLPPGRGRQRMALMGLASLLLVVGWTALAAARTVDLRVVREASSAQVVLYYLSDPAALWQVLSRTWGDPVVRAFYAESFIGILGWLDTRLPPWGYPLLGGLVLGAAALGALSANAVAAPARRGDWRLRAGLCLLALACVLIVFMALLATWSQHPAVQIQGVQGRYFLGPALVLAYGLCAAADPDAARGQAAWLLGAGAWVLALASAGASAWLLWTTLAVRYH